MTFSESDITYRGIVSLRKLFVFLIAFYSVHFASAETFVLVSKEKAVCQIATPDLASSTEKFAAEELKKYLEQISKANFEITNVFSGHSIVVGSIISLQKIEPGLNIPSLEKGEYGIFKRGQKLCLVGGSGEAVLYAVYDFLSGMGCRWLGPDFDFYEGQSQFIPLQTKLNYTYLSDRIEKAVLKYRKLYIEEGLSHNTENLKKLVDWMPKARFNILVAPLNYEGSGRVLWENWREELTPELEKRGIAIEVGGHGYQNFLNAGMANGQLYKNHPEWFGMDKNGLRSTNPHIVFCSSNPDAVAYLQSNILTYLKAHPEIDIFDFWPPDSETWCECLKCRAMGPASDRHAVLVSQTARVLHKELPLLTLECLAYSRYVKPPQKEIPDSNVLLDFCPINQSFEYQIYEDSAENNRAYKENLLSWLELFGGNISIYSYYRKYAWRSLPVIIPHYMQNDLRFYRDCGVKGISVYSEPGDWFTYGLNHYVLARLAWNPVADVDSLIKDYCTKLYGPAQNLAVSVYSELEDIVRFACKIPHTKPKDAKRYNEYISRMESCSNKIEAAIGQHSSNQLLCRHLHRLDLMLKYAIQSATLMRSTSEENKEEVAKVTENIKNLMKENATAGVFISR
jgi:hypothetical protein